jgi:hypothetical protein
MDAETPSRNTSRHESDLTVRTTITKINLPSRISLATIRRRGAEWRDSVANTPRNDPTTRVVTHMSS